MNLFSQTHVLWWVNRGRETQRVVTAADFTAADRLAFDWTNAPLGDEDVCARPPKRREFNPPALSVNAVLSEDGETLEISALVGVGTFGAYRLYFSVNDAIVGVQAATASGPFSAIAVIDPLALEADIKASVSIESVLPLPAWSANAEKIIAPCDCPEICPVSLDDLWLSWKAGGEFEEVGSEMPDPPEGERHRGCLRFVWVCVCHGAVEAWQTLGGDQEPAHLDAVTPYLSGNGQQVFAVEFYGYRTHTFNPSGPPTWIRTFTPASNAFRVFRRISPPAP